MKPILFRCIGYETRVSSLVLLLGILWCVPLHAKSTASARATDPKVSAQALLAQGMTLLEQKDFKGAYAALVAGYVKDPVPDVLYVLGKLALAEDRRLDAQDLLRRFLSDPEVDAERLGARQQEIDDVLAKGTGRSAQLWVQGDRGALVYVDDRLVGRLPLSRPLLLGPGPRQVQIVLEKLRVSDSIEVPIGRQGALRVDVPAKTMIVSIPPGILWQRQAAGLSALDLSRAERAIEVGMQRENVSPIAQDATMAPDQGSCSASPLVPGPDQSQGCLLSQARAVGADFLLTTRLSQTGQEVSLQIEVLETTTGQVAAQGTTRANTTPPERLQSAIQEALTQALREAKNRGKGQLQVVCEPAGAELLLDGRSLGKGPVERVLLSGTYELRATHVGYETRVERVEIGGAASVRRVLQLVEVVPEPPPSAPAAQARPPLWRILVGSGLAVGGVVTIGFGVTALVLNEQPYMPNGQPTGLIYDTKTIGQGLLLGGGLAVAGGVLLATLPGPRRPKNVR